MTTEYRHICPVCDMDGRIWIPIWREDVEGWGDELCTCPLCHGEGSLTPEQWAARVQELQAEDNEKGT